MIETTYTTTYYAVIYQLPQGQKGILDLVLYETYEDANTKLKLAKYELPSTNLFVISFKI